jgi:hypothetical protein
MPDEALRSGARAPKPQTPASAQPFTRPLASAVARAVPPRDRPAARTGVVDVYYATRKLAVLASTARGAKLELFLPGGRGVEGASVKACVRFGDTNRTFELDGVVAKATVVGPPGVGGSGMRICLSGPDKQRAAEMIAFCADRPLNMGTAGSRRVRVSIPCRLKSASDSAEGKVRDLSRTGAFIALKGHSGSPGSAIRLQLEPGVLGMGGGWLQARVVWRGERHGQEGVGVEVCEDGGGTRSDLLHKYLDKRR